MLALLRSKSVWLALLAVLSLAFCAYFVHAYFPGRAGNDVYVQSLQARGVTPYTDWHPPIMSVLWSTLYRATGALGSLLVLQLALYAMAMFLIAAWAYIRFASRTASLLIIVALLSPWSISQLGILWKDTQMGAAFLCAFAILLWISPKRRATLLLFIPAAILIVYAVAVRKNAAAGLPPIALYIGTLAYAAYREHRTAEHRAGKTTSRPFVHDNVGTQPARHRLASTIGCGVAAFVVLLGATQVVSTIIDRHYDVQHTGADAQFMLDDVMFSIPQKELESSGASPQLITHINESRPKCLEKHNPWNVYWTCFGRGTGGGDYSPIAESQEITHLWKTHVITHPLRYLEYRAAVYSDYLFSVTMTYDLPKSALAKQEAAGLGPENTMSDYLIRPYVQDFGTSTLKLPFLPAFWCTAAVLLLYWCRRPHTMRIEVATLATSGLLYMLAYFPVVPANQFRYTHWSAVAITVAGAIALAAWLRKRRGAREPIAAGSPAGPWPPSPHDP